MTRGVGTHWLYPFATVLVVGCAGDSGSNTSSVVSGGTASVGGGAGTGGASASTLTLGGAQLTGGKAAITTIGGGIALGGATASVHTGGVSTAQAGATASTNSGGAGAGGSSVSIGGNYPTGGRSTAVNSALGGASQVPNTAGATSMAGGTTGAGGVTQFGSTSGGTGTTGGTIARTGGVGPTGGATQAATSSGGFGATGGSGLGTGGTRASACPTSADYVGNTSWLLKAQVTERAEYCVTSAENRTLEQELAVKAKLRIAAGTYGLPDQVGTYPFAWPVCFEFAPGNEAPKFAGAGQISLRHTVYATEEFFTYRETQPLSSPQSKSLTFIGDVSNFTTPGVSPPPVVLDGSPLFELSRDYTFMICQDEECTGKWNDVWFYSCGSDEDRLVRDTIAFSGGQLVLELRIGRSNAGTQPSSFVLASGSLDGTAFTQMDYWKLVYRPEHHHYGRHYAVIFDTPIAGACGLKAESVGDTAAVAVHTIGCDLSNIDARAVTSSTTERP